MFVKKSGFFLMKADKREEAKMTNIKEQSKGECREREIYEDNEGASVLDERV